MPLSFKMAPRAAGLMIALALLFPAAGRADSAKERILKGNQFVQKKDYKNAVAQYEQAVQLSPSDPRANLLLGLAYANMGQFDKAEKFSETSVGIEPSHAGYHNLGLVYANRENFPKAIDAYEKALNLNPQAYRTWYQLGLIHSASGNFKNAIDAYQKSIAGNRDFADAYLGLGTAYYWSGEKLRALEQANELRLIRSKTKAVALEKWVEEKDAEKNKKARTPAAPEAPAPA